MSEESVIFNLLSNDITLAVLIGTKVYPVIPKPEPKGPYVVYTRDDTIPMKNLLGKCRPYEHVFRIEVKKARSYSELKQISDAIEECLDDYAGTVQGIYVPLIMAGDKQDEVDEELKIYNSTQIFSLYS